LINCSLKKGRGKMENASRKKTQVEINDIPDRKNIKLIKISGNLDVINSDPVMQVLEFFLEKNPGVNLLFDMREVQFIDSYGNLVLIKCHMKAKKNGGEVKVFSLNKNIKDIFDIVGISKLIPIFKFYEDALTSFNKE
jgi:anti-anti-sigma factor